MVEDEWVTMDLVVTTTHPVESYGGIQLSVTALEQMVEQINTNGIPLAGHHSHLRPIRTRNGIAEVRQRTDGHHEVHVVVDVARDDWDKVGIVGGMSFATSSTIGQYGDTIALEINADAAHFSRSDIVEAGGKIVARLSETSSPIEPGVKVGEYFQFSIVHDVKIVLDVTWDICVVLGPNLVASAIWDGVKHLLLRRRDAIDSNTLGDEQRTVIDIHIKKGDVKTTAVVSTSDDSVAKAAIEAIPNIIRSMETQENRVVFEWRPSAENSGSWEDFSSPNLEES
jgi:hypothetical protein